jgi:zinc transport system ATP-binding protein
MRRGCVIASPMSDPKPSPSRANDALTSCGHEDHHDHHHHGAAAGPAPADALISARGLVLQRGKRPILEAVDIDIRPQEIVTLIGPNGAGKTTLVRILLGLEKPDAGMVHRKAGLTIGYAPQRFDRDPAIPMSVARFLTLGARASREQIEAVLGEVGAARVVDQQLSGLSGGELQRVILARALIRNPGLLVLDEPVRGVDYVGEAELYGLIGRIRTQRGLGVLLVSHDLHVVMGQSDRVICLNRHVCCHGVPETVAQHPEYVRLFGAATARAFAVYTHHHDHHHDLTGAPQTDSDVPPKGVTAATAPAPAESSSSAEKTDHA